MGSSGFPFPRLVPSIFVCLALWFAWHGLFYDPGRDLPQLRHSGVWPSSGHLVWVPDPTPPLLGLEISQAVLKAAGPSSRRSRERACMANRRVMDGALEMLLFETVQFGPCPPEGIPLSRDSDLGKKLIDTGMLKFIPVCYQGGSYSVRAKSGSTDEATPKLETCCTLHGTVENPVAQSVASHGKPYGMTAAPAWSKTAVFYWLVGLATVWASVVLHILAALFPFVARKNPENALTVLIPQALKWVCVPIAPLVWAARAIYSSWRAGKGADELYGFDVEGCGDLCERSQADGCGSPSPEPLASESARQALRVSIGRQIMSWSLLPSSPLLLGMFGFPIGLIAFFILLPYNSMKAARLASFCDSPAAVIYRRQELLALAMILGVTLTLSGLVFPILFTLFGYFGMIVSVFFGILLSISSVVGCMVNSGQWKAGGAWVDDVSQLSLASAMAGLLAIISGRSAPIAPLGVICGIFIFVMGARYLNWAISIYTGKSQALGARACDRSLSVAVASFLVLAVSVLFVILAGLGSNLVMFIYGLCFVLAVQITFARDFPPMKNEPQCSGSPATEAGEEPGYGGFSLPEDWRKGKDTYRDGTNLPGPAA